MYSLKVNYVVLILIKMGSRFTGGNFNIQPDKVEEAYKHVQNIAVECVTSVKKCKEYDLSMDDVEQILNCGNLVQVMKVFEFDVGLDDRYGLYVDNMPEERYKEWYIRPIFAILASFAMDGNYIEYVNECDECYRWVVENGKLIDKKGNKVIVWDTV